MYIYQLYMEKNGFIDLLNSYLNETIALKYLLDSFTPKQSHTLIDGETLLIESTDKQETLYTLQKTYVLEVFNE